MLLSLTTHPRIKNFWNAFISVLARTTKGHGLEIVFLEFTVGRVEPSEF